MRCHPAFYWLFPTHGGWWQLSLCKMTLNFNVRKETPRWGLFLLPSGQHLFAKLWPIRVAGVEQDQKLPFQPTPFEGALSCSEEGEGHSRLQPSTCPTEVPAHGWALWTLPPSLQQKSVEWVQSQPQNCFRPTNCEVWSMYYLIKKERLKQSLFLFFAC